MERKKRSKGSVWEFCYADKMFGTFGFEIKVCGKKLVKFCGHTHTHTHAAQLVVRMLVSHCGEYPCECKKIFAANSPDSGEYMANGLTNAIRHQSQ